MEGTYYEINTLNEQGGSFLDHLAHDQNQTRPMTY